MPQPLKPVGGSKAPKVNLIAMGKMHGMREKLIKVIIMTVHKLCGTTATITT